MSRNTTGPVLGNYLIVDRFDRGDRYPALGAPPDCGGVAHMDAEGFDVLTWRQVLAANVDPDLFTDLTLVEAGRQHQWLVADTTVDRPVDDEQVFTTGR